ncbi:hypothetical protein POTOM_005339 [Populus tomentosa]|uniref:Molybdenum cofactor biosynthesis protein A-like twitch domain-containing protein n=1 Tax=Populus tomentosa TaxID=118781 RepID=A0A8X8DDV6_POPTO|nr:hypothetical protein POTOM_005339 [Populus tomentosa]
MMRRYASKFINWLLGLKNSSSSMVDCEVGSYSASRKSKCQGSFSGHLNGSLTKAYTTSCAKLSEDPQSTNLTSEMLIDSFGRMHTYYPQLLSQNETVHLANLFVSSGVDKIRLVSQRLEKLKECGLTSVNTRLDTLVPAKFEFLTRRKGHERVVDSINTAVDCGYNPAKVYIIFAILLVFAFSPNYALFIFNILTRIILLLTAATIVNYVVMRGFNDDEICDFVELTRDKPIIVRFIEFMPFDGNVWNVKKLVPYPEMLDRVGKLFPGLKRLQDHPADTTKNFRMAGHIGTVSFITSMTEHFCAGCNRL